MQAVPELLPEEGRAFTPLAGRHYGRKARARASGFT
jgi:hypothetical protein